MNPTWSQRWLETFEDNASFDDTVLRAGARLARNGYVSGLEVAPGFVSGRIEHRGTAHNAQLGVARLDDDEWAEIFRQLQESPALSVAVLVGELPETLADTAENVSLVPSATKLYPDCNCGEWNGLCGHAAALIYQVASLIDADPFILTTLRGRGRYELKAEVERARQGPDRSPELGSVHPRGADVGVSAAVAYRREREPTPHSRCAPTQIGVPIAISVPPPVDSGVLIADLENLVRSASEQARWLLTKPVE